MTSRSGNRQRSPLLVLFLTLFVDLVGFSIVFPLFPALLEYYLTREGAESLIGEVVELLRTWAGLEDPYDWRVQVLFGGALGSLYSLLQFLLSPVWGRLSDRFGRRPILLLTVTGMAISYLVWIFAASFALLVFARLLGGAMAGNISTATAAMADVTSREDRAKGMGLVGAAFGLGFILGPAIGGLLALWNPVASWPELETWGIHPFSAAATGAFLLAALNLWWVWSQFEESLPPEKRGSSSSDRRIHPKALVGLDLPSPVRRTNLAYFVFLLAFGGMEFTLTFLVRDRLGWSPTGIAIMFVYVGLVLATVQGGLVRRLAPRYGEKRLALAGMALVVPGLALLGVAETPLLLYLGLTPMAVGSALVIPSFTALVSLYSPPERQGAALGVYRSVGALSRALGPILASLVYWRFGSSAPYLAGAVILLLPLWIAFPLPRPAKDSEPA